MTKEKVEKLLSDDITKKEYDTILKEIDDRVYDIWLYILKQQNRGYTWIAYGNDVEYANGNGSSGGWFDPEKYSVYIEMSGDVALGYYLHSHTALKNEDYTYLEGFPTELIWDDEWKKSIDDRIDYERGIIKNQKQSKDDTKDKYKNKRLDLARSVRSKLTKEEIKFIKTRFNKKELEILEK